jgi:hypothetical protein
MAFPGFKFQIFSGGECPRTPLIMRGFGVRHGQGFRLDPRLLEIPLDEAIDILETVKRCSNDIASSPRNGFDNGRDFDVGLFYICFCCCRSVKYQTKYQILAKYQILLICQHLLSGRH